MDVSWWWRVFLMTYVNHSAKCGKSLTSKASYIRDLFHQDRRWMENIFATFWGDWEKTSCSNFQTSGATSHGPWIMTMLRLMCRLLCSSSWLLRIRQSSPTLPTHWTSSHVLLPIPEEEIETQGATFWECWRDPDRIAERDEDADTKWLPEVFQIMKIPLESLYQCQRGLLWRGWWQIEILVSGWVMAEEFQELLGSTT